MASRRSLRWTVQLSGIFYGALYLCLNNFHEIRGLLIFIVNVCTRVFNFNKIHIAPDVFSNTFIVARHYDRLNYMNVMRRALNNDNNNAITLS